MFQELVITPIQHGHLTLHQAKQSIIVQIQVPWLLEPFIVPSFITILDNDEGWYYIQYPVSGGNKRGYVPISTVSPNIYGYLDAVNTSAIYGWAKDKKDPNSSATVDIYIRKRSNGQTANAYRLIANNYRSDVGYHGYSYTIDWTTYPPDTYYVDAYGIGDTNPLLTNSGMNFTVQPSTGCVDYVNSNGIGGWAWKPQAPNSSIQAHVYIYTLAWQQVSATALSANQYRSDLASLGYGNGYHGFSMGINWSSLPEEQLRVIVYSVDGSGNNPSFYNAIYDNRKKIDVIGMRDENGFNFATWINSNVLTACNNIGYSSIGNYMGANNYAVTNMIKESSYFAITTHGNTYGIMCNYLSGSAPNYTNNFSDLTSWDIEALDDGYFNTTRCVLLNCCLTGNGGANDPDNFVNALHSKGVWSVVGFQEETIFYYTGTNTVIGDKGNQLWAREFTAALGRGETINQAIGDAINAVQEADGNLNGDQGGLDSVYVAGNINQVVKH